MPIKNLTDKPRFPRAGKIHLGIKSDSGGYPEPVDHFHVKEDQSTTKESNIAFHKMYGDEPKIIDILLPYDNLDEIFPQWWKRYVKRGHGGVLMCRGDGVDATELNEASGLWDEKHGACATCEMVKAGKCKKVGNFKFMLPFVDGGGIWQIDTGSVNSIRNLNGMIMMAIAYAKMSGKSLAQIPMKLIVNMQDIPYKVKDKTTGDLKTSTRSLPILQMQIMESLTDILKHKDKKELSARKTDPINEADKEVPEDLVSPKALEQQEQVDQAEEEIKDLLGAPTNKEIDDLKKEIEACKDDAAFKKVMPKMSKIINTASAEQKKQLAALYNKKRSELRKDDGEDEIPL
jgi:hypothetical protein